jgi:hypothetical protein
MPHHARHPAMLMIFTLLLPFTFVCGRGATFDPPPQPLVPINWASPHYADELGKMRATLAEKKTEDFYAAAFSLNDKMRRTLKGKEKLPGSGYGKPEAVAREWWLYYVASAPTFPREKLSELGHTQILQDITYKRVAGAMLASMDAGETARLLGQNKQRLTELHIIWTQHILRQLFFSGKEAADLKNSLAKELAVFDARPFSYWEQKFEENQQSPNPEIAAADVTRLIKKGRYRITDKLGAVGGRARESIAYADKFMQVFLKNITSIHARQPERVQEILRKAGYETPEKRARVLQKHLGRTREVEAFFRGLPDEKSLAQIDARKEMDLQKKHAQETFSPSLKLAALALHHDSTRKIERAGSLAEIHASLSEFDTKIKALGDENFAIKSELELRKTRDEILARLDKYMQFVEKHATLEDKDEINRVRDETLQKIKTAKTPGEICSLFSELSGKVSEIRSRRQRMKKIRDS